MVNEQLSICFQWKAKDWIPDSGYIWILLDRIRIG
jgi:hypothetical protein